MNINIVIPIVTAIIGGMLAGIPSFISYRIKKMELNHLYEVNKTKMIRDTANQYCKDIYIPFYNILNSFQVVIMDSKMDKHSYESAIGKLSMDYRTLLVNEHKIYLTDDIEMQLNSMYWFIDNSLNCEKAIVSVRTTSVLFGVTLISNINREFESEKSANIFKYCLELFDFITKIIMPFSYFFDMKRLANVEYKIYYKCAPLGSDSFNKQILDYVEDTKQSIKRIIL